MAELSSRALCTVAEVKDAAEIDPASKDQDDRIIRLINAASSRIHVVAGREFKAVGTNPQTRSFDVTAAVAGKRELWVGDLASFTAVTTKRDDGTTVESVATSKIVTVPRVREEWQPIRRLKFLSGPALAVGYVVEVTGNFGFPAVPETVKQDAIDTVVFLLQRETSKFSETFGAEEGSPEPATLSLPPWVLRDLQQFQLPPVA